ncbi:MAG: TusE/DsrC/DsvC family sulfur relay protein [Proteobacteria bacterium]|nr:TusE/DsrC/DsvC family sulfur relay protein [Pseudomonadota bacterium]
MSKETKKTTTFEGKTYTLDQHGFLYPPEQWDEIFARGMALKVGIPAGLTAEHWRLVRYLRDKFTGENTVPLVVNACIDNNLRLSRLRQMFPTGYHRGACKIAGLNYNFMAQANIWLTYENYSTIKSEYKISGTGFLENFNQWNKRFALLVMQEWNLPQGVTDKHREIIQFLRNYYDEKKDIPTVYEMCRSNNISLQALMELFPDGYRRGACRAAGLPFLG